MDCVRVAVRIRPLVKSETDRGCQDVIEKVADEPQIVIKSNDMFTFNYVFTPENTQERIYEDAVKGMVETLFKGYNVTILAYGQTGSGKTHTMGTAFSGVMDEETGVIPRAMYDIFKQIADMPDHTFTVSCSFMELYQEQLYDLLSNGSREQSVVDIREDGSRGIVIPGLTEKLVSSAQQITDHLMKGSSGRAVGATAMNAQSSRSHAIFTVTVQMMKTNKTNTSTTSKFHLVDLAGSERSKKTKATGERFKEGVKINQGLLALGNVISALGSGQGSGYIGYRDSKLTRLLQDSLGGNSITLMIACVSPADYNMEETLSTLRYADRARKIKNKPIVNQDPKVAEINKLNGVIEKLRLQLLNNGGNGNTSMMVSNQDMQVMKKNYDNLLEKNRNLQQQLQAALNDVADIEMRAVVAETASDDLHHKVLKLNDIISGLNHFDKETCPDDFQKIQNLREVVGEIDKTLKQNKEDLLDHKKSISSVNNTLSQTNMECLGTTEAMQHKVDAFTSKQVDFSNELRRLNRELGLKEELHHKVVGNLSKFCTYEGGENGEQKIKEFESMIDILESEKTELLDKLKCVKENASAKIAEDRRKRLQQLELQISELRKKNIQQAKLLKLREKESQKICNLNNEIQAMKTAKVKLIRAMRSDSESFRQWKLNREKELTHLKEKDRKRVNEMARMESMHNKQRNVLRRKVEEAVAINKRLKDALEKQKIAQSKRKQNTAGKVDHVLTWIDHELEVILSVIDAEHSLEQLMEDRAVLSGKLKDLQECNSNDQTDLNTLEEEIQTRNAQINDLQQKVIASDIESKMVSICENMQSMPEARAALKHLFTAITEMRKEYITKENKIDDLKSAIEMAEEKIENLEKTIQNQEIVYKEEISSVEKNYEEKITVLLRELYNTPKITNGEITPEMDERQKIELESLDKLDALREELDEYKLLYNELKIALEAKTVKKPKNKRLQIMNQEILEYSFTTDSEQYDDDDERDPDWHKTPLKLRSKNINTSREGKSSKDSSYEAVKRTSNEAVKRTSNGISLCRCKGTCSTKKCPCRKNESSCSEGCKCKNVCQNKSQVSEDLEEKENIQNSDDIFLEPELTPKKFKLSSDKLDVTTPCYPYDKKKRKPFFD